MAGSTFQVAFDFKGLPMVRLVLLIVATFVSNTVAADELPRRKSGLWSMSVTMPGASIPLTMQQCIDEKTDDITGTMADKSKTCRNQTKRTGDRLSFDSICKTGKTTSTTRGVFVGDFKSGYTVESTTAFEPPVAGMREGVTKAAAQWTGPCKSDMKPGDVVMSNGARFNVNDYKAAKKK
jgi:hypothetical protein